MKKQRVSVLGKVSLVLFFSLVTSEASFFQRDQKEEQEISHPLVLIAGSSTYEDQRIKHLPNATSDMNRLHRLFVGFYGYQVLTTYDSLNDLNEKNRCLLKEDFTSLCREVQDRLRNNKEGYDGLIVIFFGYQKEEVLLFSDGKELSLREIEAYFSSKECPSFAGMPKIFIETTYHKPIPSSQEENKKELLPHQTDRFFVTGLDIFMKKLGTHQNSLTQLVKKSSILTKMASAFGKEAHLLDSLYFKKSFYFFADLIRQAKELRLELSYSSHLKQVKSIYYVLRWKQIAYWAIRREVNVEGIRACFSLIFKYMEWDFKRLERCQKKIYKRWIKLYKGCTLKKAFLEGNMDVIKVLVIQGYHKDQSNFNNHALHYAAQYGWIELIQWLIEIYKVDRNARNSRGEHALHVAAQYGKEDVIILLLDLYKIDINVRCKENRHALHFAVGNHWKNGIKLFLDKYKVNSDVRDQHGNHVLHYAAASGWKVGIEFLLDTYKVDINVQDKEGSHALHFGARYGREGVMKLLLDKYKVNPDVRDKNGRHVLHYAVQYGKKGVTKLLLDTYKVDVNVRDKNRRHALHFTVANNREEVFQLLVHTYKVDIDTRDKWGLHALHTAACYGQKKMLKLLFERHKVDINVRDQDGSHALHFAAWHGKKKVIKWLINTYKVDIHVANNRKEMALHIAAKKNRKATYALLVRLGANEEVKNNNGKTPRELKTWKHTLETSANDQRCNEHNEQACRFYSN